MFKFPNVCFILLKINFNLIKMFYPVDSLRRGGRFYLCWLADSWPERFATITQRQLWAHDIRKICDDLLKVMTSESGRPVNRFSLRLSSQLMRGLVRLYHRKVSLYLVDLVMTNASVFKHINKKGHVTEVIVTEHVLPRLPVLEQPQVALEPDNEQQVAELIQNSNNAVRNIQDITLKEAVIPDFQLPPNDGFGEEHPDQALQLAVDRTIETMMRADVSAQQISALSAALDNTEHDRSRLAPLDVQMEAATDLDLTLLRKSLGQDLLAAGDLNKEIPEIPEIPIPEMPVPVPQPDKQTPERPVQQVPKVVDEQNVAQRAPEVPVDIELEELEEPPAKRRRKHKLIIDKSKKIAANVLHARIANPRVELRCEDVIDDVIDLRLPVDLYFRRPAHAGHKAKSNIANVLNRLFLRNLGVVPEHLAVEREMELLRVQRSLRHHDRSALETIEEETAVHDKTQAIGQPMDIAREMIYVIDQPLDKTTDAAATDQLMQPEQPLQVEVDIADLPTQKLETVSQAEKRKIAAITSPRKRLRASDCTSFRLRQQLAIEAQVPIAEAEKENIPQPIYQQSPTKSPEKSQRNVLTMLEQAGLADVAEPRFTETVPETLQPSLEKTAKKNGSESSETPLGSLDRTKVSLGDSDKTTDSIRFIRDEWGTVGTMTKIMQAIKYGPRRPITVWYLMSKGPVIEKYKNVIAARCFTSILKLKHHGFIIVRKEPETLEIRDIILGPKFD